ncbi:TlpA disulfide reductase family protein [Litoreibacter janthinus]|uniref:Thiol-disulfide isomerase or thioredoxin n=1 Tax=Litoreibacter janthinus TaxID=670154 RepID=A0A1I6FT32_9RHOB|nr:TlpA disulfide reductase family protein [Litoreibacter janthinus]SFR33066.1 Thiol-disulfide isomerase or thioredoxin [Litoreibacter janthinus]
MRFLKLLVLYAGLAAGANPAVADTNALFTLAEGDLAKLQLHGESRAVPETAVTDADGNAVTLSDYRGKHVLLNFWALWCAPCVKEMPSLERLDAKLGGAQFEVVTIATGRNSKPAVDKFFVDKGISHLPKLFDPKMALMRDIGGSSLPLTVLIGPDGREVARMKGDAEWDSPAALAMLRGWMSGS